MKLQYHVKPLHKDPKFVEPCCLGCKVTVVVIAPVQGASLMTYLNKEVVVHHRQSIAVRLAEETPIAKEKWHFLQ